MNNLARAFVPPAFEVVIPCSAGEHTVTVIDGIPQRGPHDSGDERALAVLAGDKPTCVRAREAIIDAARHETGKLDPVIRTFPEPLKRLALLAWAHRDIEITVWQSAVANVSKFVRTILTKEARALGIGEEIRFELRDGPAIAPAKERRKTTAIVAREWPATVFMFGLTSFEDRLTLGAELSPKSMVLSQLETRPRPHLIETSVSYARALPGFVLVEGARA